MKLAFYDVNITVLAYTLCSFKVRGPFIQTLCIENDSYMDAI